MRNVVVQTKNVRAFMGATETLERRGATEACFGLIEGEPGHGKSRIGQWWAVQNEAVFIRLKSVETPLWFLRELARELGEAAPAHRYEDVYGQVAAILSADPRPIVVDEVEHGLRDRAAVIEALRDVVDFVEVPALLLGREHIPGVLKRHKQIWTRVSAHATFGALDAQDVDLCFRELAECQAEPAVIAAAYEQSGGRMRLILNAIKTVERIGLSRKRPVTAADIDGLDLTLERAKTRNGRAAPSRPKSAASPALEVVQ